MMALFHSKKKMTPAKRMLLASVGLLEYIEDREERVRRIVANYSDTSADLQDTADRATSEDERDA